tara:strand:- start:98 stop:232 length:135 start_codon:yes stop_codon:yes gene_type:complete
MSTIARQWYCQDKPICGHWNTMTASGLMNQANVNKIDNQASDIN